MAHEVKVPTVGESVTEGMISQWHFQDGDLVKIDDVLMDLETDKATVEIIAEKSGRIQILKQAGQAVKVGEVIAKIDEQASGSKAAEPKAAEPKAAETPKESKDSKKSEPKKSGKAASSKDERSFEPSPAVRRLADEKQIDVSSMSGSGKDGRVTKADLIDAPASDGNEARQSPAAPAAQPASARSSAPAPSTADHGERKEWREPMSMMRRRIAERLVASQQTAAILTTFNEVDTTAIKNLRAKYKDSFKEKHGVNLGFMSFFVKAACHALKKYPRINGWIDGTDIVYHSYCDVGVAVSTEKGLMVPVVRNADRMNFAEIEQAIGRYADKARAGKISLDDLSGGTFTVSNGGVFGSLMSTPILNPPQSGILGMHKIQDRPMVMDGEIKIRPMMYLAMSYDHRIVDGLEAVGFLVSVKECIEDPARLLLDL